MDGHKSKIKYGEEVDGLRIGIASRQDKKLETFWLDLYIENNSEDTIYFVSTHFFKNFSLEVKNSKVETVPMISSKQEEINKIISSGFTRRISIQLNPGKVYLVNPSPNLNEWYNFKALEKYQLIATMNEGLTKPIYPVSGKLQISKMKNL